MTTHLELLPWVVILLELGFDRLHDILLALNLLLTTLDVLDVLLPVTQLLVP